MVFVDRYSDIIVHRLLAVSIGADASYPELLDKNKTQVRYKVSLMSRVNYHWAAIMYHDNIVVKQRFLYVGKCGASTVQCNHQC